jgi:regulator of sigma E protease
LITSVAGEPVKTWDEAQKRIEENAEHTIAVVVERVGADHKVETLQVTPKLAPNKNIMSFKREVGDIDGLTIQARAPMVGIRDPKSVAAVAGLKTGDAIKSINGVAVGRWREFMADLGNQIATPGDQPITLDIERGVLDEKKADNPDKLKIALPRVADAKSADEILAKWGIEYPELYLARTEDGSPAQKGGLQKGDRLVEMDGHPVMTFDDIAATVKAAGDRSTKGAQPEPIKIVAERDGVALNLSIAPNLRERMSQQGKEERHFEIGIGPMIVDAQPLMVENRATSFPNAVVQGITQTIHMTGFVAMTFVRLVQREVSAKNIGGFLSIGQMAKKSWQFGATPFLSLMAFISVNLFVLNLLPVPVLDGGHLVFYSIEAIKGGPLSLRKMEIAQQVGLALLLALMVFALYNDVTRLFLPKS